MAHGDLSVGNDAAGTGDHADNTVGAGRISHRFGVLHHQPGNRIEVCGSDPAVLLLLCGSAACDKGKKQKLGRHFAGACEHHFHPVYGAVSEFDPLPQRLPFIYEMPSVMKITDLMVTRAGASTMSEITALEVPSIFIPSPYVTNNHQYKNAMDLVDNNAGLILEEKDLTDTSLINLIDKTINDENKLKEMKSNLKKLGIKDSGERIYNILKDLILDEQKFY